MKSLLCASVCLALLVAMKFTAQASTGPTMTQMELIQWLVQLSGEGETIKADATAQDYLAWAQQAGINPNGGWNPKAALTRDVLAQALVQFFNFKAKAGTDPIAALKKEGIVLPSNLDRGSFASLVDQFGFQNRPSIVDKKPHSKHKPPTKHKPFPTWANGNHNGWHQGHYPDKH